MLSWLRNWWYTRVQKDLATFFGSLALLDLTPYADDIHDFIPWKHWHAALRLTGAFCIWWRAQQATRKPPE